LFSLLCPAPSVCSAIRILPTSRSIASSRTGHASTRTSSTVSVRSRKARLRGSPGAKKPYHLARHAPNILINGNRVMVVWDEQARPWFECQCGRRCKHLYPDALACRTCCGLDYASRHLHRSVPGVHRVMRWRRQLGIDPHPFAAIPKRPRHHTRFHRIVAQIRDEESKLVGHLGGVTRDLERRARLRGMLAK